MRVIRRSVVLAALLLSAVNTAPAAAGAACGPLKIMTSLDLIRLQSGRPAIEVLIGEEKHTMLVDTGGFLSMLSSRAVTELGLTPTQTRGGVIGVRGQVMDQAVRLPSITIGQLRQEGAYFWVYDVSTMETSGLIGPDMLQNFDADFDFHTRKLNLISPDHCAGNVVHWTTQAVPVAVIPMTLDRAGHITVPVELDGRRVRAILDTGANVTILNIDIARRNFRLDLDSNDVEKVGEITGNYSAAIYRRQFKTLAFEGVVIGNPMITMYPDMIGGGNLGERRTGSLIRDDRRGLPDLILGMNVLSQMHVYIAYKERKLYITAASPQAAAAPQ